MEKELETLVGKQWLQFAAIIPHRTLIFFRLSTAIFGQCKSNLEFHDCINRLDEIPGHLKLALTMSASEIKTEKKLDSVECKRIVEISSELESQLTQNQDSISKTISLSPNLCGLIGSKLALQVLSKVELEILARTPPSNLGNKIPQLEESDLIKRFSPNEKQAIRQICGKIVLCARLDLQKTNDDTLGKRWFKEIDERLNKFKKAPELQAIKPLPIPLDVKSKKRGGRRVRKMKEKMEMSQVERLQNRVAFGERETTKIVGDEEVGMGLLDRKKVQAVRLLSKNPTTPLTKREDTSDGFESDLLQFL